LVEIKHEVNITGLEGYQQAKIISTVNISLPTVQMDNMQLENHDDMER
jgi:hypothetical protein